MKVFVLRDSKGEYLARDVDIGPLFDIGALVESETDEKTHISAEDLDDILVELKQNRNS